MAPREAGSVYEQNKQTNKQAYRPERLGQLSNVGNIYLQRRITWTFSSVSRINESNDYVPQY